MEDTRDDMMRRPTTGENLKFQYIDNVKQTAMRNAIHHSFSFTTFSIYLLRTSSDPLWISHSNASLTPSPVLADPANIATLSSCPWWDKKLLVLEHYNDDPLGAERNNSAISNKDVSFNILSLESSSCS